MNHKLLLLSLFGGIVLTLWGCASPTGAPATQTNTIFPILTATVTISPSPTSTHTLQPTPTDELTTTPIPLEEQVLISRTEYTGDGVDEFYSCLTGYNDYFYVLYADGRLVTFKGIYLEAKVSQAEIDKLLADIEATGFFSIKPGEQYIQGAPTPSESSWNWGSNIQVKDQSINLRQDIFGYKVDALKKTERLLEDFQPPDTSVYYPKSIVLWLFDDGTDEANYYAESLEPFRQNEMDYWVTDIIRLDELNGGKVFSGEQLDFVMQQIEALPDYRIVEQDGKRYHVFSCPNFHGYK